MSWNLLLKCVSNVCHAQYFLFPLIQQFILEIYFFIYLMYFCLCPTPWRWSTFHKFLLCTKYILKSFKLPDMDTVLKEQRHSCVCCKDGVRVQHCGYTCKQRADIWCTVTDMETQQFLCMHLNTYMTSKKHTPQCSTSTVIKCWCFSINHSYKHQVHFILIALIYFNFKNEYSFNGSNNLYWNSAFNDQQRIERF